MQAAMMMFQRGAEGVANMAQQGGRMMEEGGRMMMRGGHGGGGFFGSLIPTVVIVLVVLWVIKNWDNPKNPLKGLWEWLISTLQSVGSGVSAGLSGGAKSAEQTPLVILQTRYAKGEITREEYEAIRRDLTGEVPITQG